MTSIEKYYGIDAATAAAMGAAMDAAAKEFWAYPETLWQLGFEMGWLQEHGYVDAARKAAESIDMYMYVEGQA